MTALCAHGGVPAQHGLDLAELDAESAQLHLLIDAPHEHDVAVGQVAGEVAGAVHAGARRVRSTGRG